MAKKNIRPVAGRPLIAYAIGAALGSHCVERILVSTDDVQIAEVAGGCGAEVPFLRPPELAGDDSPTVDALVHALEWLQTEQGYAPEFTLLIQATSPLVRAADIEEVHAILRDKGADAVVSVCEAHPSPYWMHKLEEDGRMVDFVETKPESRRQDLPPIYGRNGALWLARTEILVRRRSFITKNTYSYIMETERSLEVDGEADLAIADLLLAQEARGA